MSTETDNFLAEMVPKQLAADGAIHDGDAGPRLALWSENEPLTLFGASLSGSGRAELEPVFRNVASWFSHSDSFDLEIIAAGVSGDLAYTVGYEHTTTTVEGTPRKYSLRVTHAYRRENGAWRIVHRHADFPAGEASVPLPAGRTGPMTGERQAMGRETEAFLVVACTSLHRRGQAYWIPKHSAAMDPEVYREGMQGLLGHCRAVAATV